MTKHRIKTTWHRHYIQYKTIFGFWKNKTEWWGEGTDFVCFKSFEDAKKKLQEYHEKDKAKELELIRRKSFKTQYIYPLDSKE